MFSEECYTPYRKNPSPNPSSNVSVLLRVCVFVSHRAFVSLAIRRESSEVHNDPPRADEEVQLGLDEVNEVVAASDSVVLDVPATLPTSENVASQLPPHVEDDDSWKSNFLDDVARSAQELTGEEQQTSEEEQTSEDASEDEVEAIVGLEPQATVESPIPILDGEARDSVAREIPPTLATNESIASQLLPVDIQDDDLWKSKFLNDVARTAQELSEEEERTAEEQRTSEDASEDEVEAIVGLKPRLETEEQCEEALKRYDEEDEEEQCAEEDTPDSLVEDVVVPKLETVIHSSILNTQDLTTFVTSDVPGNFTAADPSGRDYTSENDALR
ncbi:hypothetical protein NEOLEDRAFT_1183367, partial [Neolentinus lepideus HHB14362 ss-1]